MLNKSSASLKHQQEFVTEWCLNAPAALLLIGLVIGIGLVFLPLSSFLISCCFGVGAEAIGWVMPLALGLSGIAVGLSSGKFIGERQQGMIERHFSFRLTWQKSTQIGLAFGFALGGLLFLPLAHLLCPMDALCTMLCCFHAIAFLLPIVSLIVGFMQWFTLRDVIGNSSHQWLIVQFIAALLVSGMFVTIFSDEIGTRIVGAIIIVVCLIPLRHLVDVAWSGIIKHLAAIVIGSKLLFMVGDDVLLAIGVHEATVDTTFFLIYLTVFLIVLSTFKANIEASYLSQKLNA